MSTPVEPTSEAVQEAASASSRRRAVSENDESAAQGFRADPARVLTLTDGVIAIAMTLLALDLKPAVVDHMNSSHDLSAYLDDNKGIYFAFILAFLIIAQYWIVHHRMVTDVDHHGLRFAWANMLFLLGITLLPVTTYILGAFTGRLPTVLYAADLILISIALALLDFVIRHYDLRRQPRTKQQVRQGQIRAILTVLIPVVVIIVTLTTDFNANYLFFLYALQGLPGSIADRRRRKNSEVPAP